MAGVVHEEDFDEGEVWDVLQEAVATEKEAARRLAIPPWNRTRSGKNKQAAAVSSEGARRSNNTARTASSSAPVAIPAAGSSSRRRRQQEDEEGEMLPPHEWLAWKMQRMGGVSAPASPPEAFGGRSKAREMRKVRDAVLPKTAFSEQ